MSETMPSSEITMEREAFQSRVILLGQESSPETEINPLYFKFSSLIPIKIFNNTPIVDFVSDFMIRTKIFEVPQRSAIRPHLEDYAQQVDAIKPEELMTWDDYFKTTNLNQYYQVLEEVIWEYSENVASVKLREFKNFLNYLVLDCISRTTTLSQAS